MIEYFWDDFVRDIPQDNNYVKPDSSTSIVGPIRGTNLNNTLPPVIEGFEVNPESMEYEYQSSNYPLDPLAGLDGILEDNTDDSNMQNLESANLIEGFINAQSTDTIISRNQNISILGIDNMKKVLDDFHVFKFIDRDNCVKYLKNYLNNFSLDDYFDGGLYIDFLSDNPSDLLEKDQNIVKSNKIKKNRIKHKKLDANTRQYMAGLKRDLLVKHIMKSNIHNEIEKEKMSNEINNFSTELISDLDKSNLSLLEIKETFKSKMVGKKIELLGYNQLKGRGTTSSHKEFNTLIRTTNIKLRAKFIGQSEFIKNIDIKIQKLRNFVRKNDQNSDILNKTNLENWLINLEEEFGFIRKIPIKRINNFGYIDNCLIELRNLIKDFRNLLITRIENIDNLSLSQRSLKLKNLDSEIIKLRKDISKFNSLSRINIVFILEQLLNMNLVNRYSLEDEQISFINKVILGRIIEIIKLNIKNLYD